MNTPATDRARAAVADDAAVASTLEALEQAFVLLRQIALEGRDSTSVQNAAAAFAAALQRAAPPFALQLLPEAVMRDHVPLPLSLEAFRRAQQLVAALSRLGVQEIAVDAVPAPHVLCEFGEVLFDAAHKGRHARGVQLPGLRLRALPRMHADSSAGEAVLDRFASQQVALACEEAAALATTSEAWPWHVGRALVWRIERSMKASVSATSRALELAPGAWPHARSIATAAFHVGAVLARLQVSPLSQRAAMHAALALAAHGLGQRGGVPLAAAARAGWPALLAVDEENDYAAHEVDPHRLRVCTLMRAAMCEAPASAPLLVPLLHVAYELERQRCPAGGALQLSRLDLQVWLAGALGHEVHPGFSRALLGMFGIVPVGSHVVAEGRLGVVLGAGTRDDPRRPRVLVGGQIMQPATQVQLYSPLGMSPWVK